MTVAQLVHSSYARVPQSRHAPFHTLRRDIFRRWSRNAALWRAIGLGLGFALVGLVLMTLAISAAGGVPTPQPQGGDALALARPAPAPAPAQPLDQYQRPGNPWANTMPLP